MPKAELNYLILREVGNFIIDKKAKKLSPKLLNFTAANFACGWTTQGLLEGPIH